MVDIEVRHVAGKCLSTKLPKLIFRQYSIVVVKPHVWLGMELNIFLTEITLISNTINNNNKKFKYEFNTWLSSVLLFFS